MNPARVSALAFAATLGFAALSHAQTPPPAPPPPPGMAMHHWNHDRAGDPHAMHAAAHLKALHDALNIRPDQEGAFQTFAASMRPPRHEGTGMSEGRGPGMDGPEPDRTMGAPAAMTAPERADRMVKRFDDRTGMMREALVKHAEAVKTFYAVLSPEQRHTLDALATLMGHPGGPMRGMPEPGMGPGGPGRPGEAG